LTQEFSLGSQTAVIDHVPAIDHVTLGINERELGVAFQRMFIDTVPNGNMIKQPSKEPQ
jgi:hypothetical protein